MKIFHGTENANISRPTVLTLGVFDGLHLGHQQIIRTVVERASLIGAVPTAITFDPHPRAVLYPEKAPALLQTLDQRLAGFEYLGIKQAIVIRFNKEFASQDAEDFLRHTISERLQAKEVYLGKGFEFGKGRHGNIDLLRKISKQMNFFADEVPEIRLRNKRVSSSRVREALFSGKVNIARRLLGRPYGVEGQIEHGSARGHEIGFPTANLKPQNRVIPQMGVYVTATLINDVWRKSVTNIGVRPTFENNVEPSIESFIFNYEGDLYGDVLRVRFLHRLRDERKFSGIEELKSQISKDARRALSFFDRSGVKNMLEII